MSEIVKAKLERYSVELRLENGVRVSISSNPGSLHIHFSNVVLDEHSIFATASVGNPESSGQKFSNYLDLMYTPRKE